VLRFHPVVVHFDEELIRSKNVAIFGRALVRLLDVICLNRAVDFARETTTQSNQAR